MSELLDTVAEAIWQAIPDPGNPYLPPPLPFSELSPQDAAQLRRMAQAAIDAESPNTLRICGWCIRMLHYCLSDPCDDRKNS